MPRAKVASQQIAPLNFRETLTHEDIVIISDHLRNEYLTHEEPARSAVLKLHRIAESLRGK